MPLICPTCGGYLNYYPAYPNKWGHRVPPDIRCIHCGRSVIHSTCVPEPETQGSGYSNKEHIKKICLFCEQEFISKVSNQLKKFCKVSCRTEFWKLKNRQKKHDNEEKRIGRIKWKVKHKRVPINDFS